MKCCKCGEEIKVGSVYCQNCGEPAQIVPDYNVLEDDIIVSYLNEQKNAEKQPQKEQPEQEGKTPEKKKAGSAQKKAAIFAVIAAALVVVVLALYLTSYSYCIAKGKRCDAKEDYAQAVACYEKAIGKREDRAEAYRLAGADLLLLKDYEKAESYLLLAIEKDPNDVEAYETLLQLYVATKDDAALERLKEADVTPEVQKLFQKLLVSPPEFSEEEGTYGDDLELSLSCDGDQEIFYTLDGSDPVKGGTRYEGTIMLTEGSTTVKAVARNADGNYSLVTENTYEIAYEKPDYPEVSPSEGSFTAPTFVQVTIPEGCTVYYTWDGSRPTESSAVCTEPLAIPEGNNILSLLLVDEHGMQSDVLQCNYRYLPQ